MPPADVGPQDCLQLSSASLQGSMTSVLHRGWDAEPLICRSCRPRVVWSCFAEHELKLLESLPVLGSLIHVPGVQVHDCLGVDQHLISFLSSTPTSGRTSARHLLCDPHGGVFHARACAVGRRHAGRAWVARRTGAARSARRTPPAYALLGGRAADSGARGRGRERRLSGFGNSLLPTGRLS